MLNFKIRLLILAGLAVIVLLIVLFFGLRGKGYHYRNNVTWLEYGPGIRFGNYGIACGLIEDVRIKKSISGLKAFSIEMALKSEAFYQRGFNIILCLHDGSDRDQLVVGEYGSYIIVMNGDDYSHRRKIKRISTDVFSQAHKKTLLTVTTGDKGTKLYVDGSPAGARSDLVLSIPEGERLMLTLGNSVHGNGFWKGDIYGVALYGGELDPETIAGRFRDWSQDRALSFSGDSRPLMAFSFNEGKGTETKDAAGGVQKLGIPSRFVVPEKQYLSLRWGDFKADRSFLFDIIINFLGFIPLGFVICALFSQFGGILQKRAVLFSVLFCFLTSLGIEVSQAWIPSRSSQAMDLALNTTGAFIGAKITKLKYLTGLKG